jgi:hypothetical protein
MWTWQCLSLRVQSLSPQSAPRTSAKNAKKNKNSVDCSQKMVVAQFEFELNNTLNWRGGPHLNDFLWALWFWRVSFWCYSICSDRFSLLHFGPFRHTPGVHSEDFMLHSYSNWSER